MRRSLALALVVVVTLLPFAATVHAMVAGPTLRHTPVGVGGPVLVAQAVSDSLDSLPGSPFDAIVYAPLSEAVGSEAAGDVAAGRLAAAVELDLAGSTDTLYVADDATADLVDEIRARAAVVAEGYGRQVVVERVPPTAGPRGSGELARWLFVGWCLVGVLLAAVVTALRGPVAPTARRGVARVSALGGLGALVGGVSGAVAAGLSSTYDVATVVEVGVVGATLTATVAWVVTAVEAFAGLAGLPAAAALMLAPAAALLVIGDPRTLPAPWHVLHRLLPHDGASELLSHLMLGQDVGVARAVVVLGSWPMVALVALAAARRERPTVSDPAAVGP